MADPAAVAANDAFNNELRHTFETLIGDRRHGMSYEEGLLLGFQEGSAAMMVVLARHGLLEQELHDRLAVNPRYGPLVLDIDDDPPGYSAGPAEHGYSGDG